MTCFSSAVSSDSGLLRSIRVLLSIASKKTNNTPTSTKKTTYLRCFQLKVRHDVVLQIGIGKPKLQKMPRPILDTVIRRQFLSALRQEGLTKPLIIFAMLQQIVILVIILALVFTGFAALTDVYQLLTGILNTAIVALVCVAFHNQQVRKDGNAKTAREQVFYVQHKRCLLRNAIERRV
jgi:hypothetical protein